MHQWDKPLDDENEVYESELILSILEISKDMILSENNVKH